MLLSAAKTTHSTNISFEDPEWFGIIDELLKFTQRSAFIKQFTGIDVSESRVKDYAHKRLTEMGLEILKPRGNPAATTSGTFLSDNSKRLHFTKLISMHYGSVNPATAVADVTERSIKMRVQKAINIYSNYQRSLGSDKALVSFESYILMIDSIKTGYVVLRKCPTCGARVPYLTTDIAKMKNPAKSKKRQHCVVCRDIAQAVDSSIEKVAAALELRKSGMPGALAGEIVNPRPEPPLPFN